MAHHVELHGTALTDTGKVRVQNEDAVALLPEIGVAILADGMGGYQAGEVASRMAVDMCAVALKRELAEFDWAGGGERNARLAQLLRQAVSLANVAIHRAGQEQGEYAGMGTTVVVTLCHHDKLIVAHVGDSRAYCLRAGQLEQITRDHSQVEEQIEAGLITRLEARSAPNRNLVTRALGIDGEVDVELRQLTTRVGDLYLLCSDGLSDMVDDETIADILGSAGNDLDAAARNLVERANLLGGVDNISAILFRIDAITAEAADTPGLLGRMLDWVR